MKKQLLATAIAGALAAPGAFAAQDTSGMQYTSAAEGFYASIRVRYNSGKNDNAGADIQNSASRIGVRGSNDLGGGMSGFYQYELGVGTNNGDSVSTRLGHVGLRGAFGEIVMGSIWGNGYNWTYGSTDVANVSSGNLVYNDLAPGRASKVVQYTTPDFNGFKASAMVGMGNSGNATTKDNNDVDQYLLAATYSMQGFSAGAAYSVISDFEVTGGTGDKAPYSGSLAWDGTEDLKAWAIKGGYAQDNWYANVWYAEVNTSDRPGSAATEDDSEVFSIAGGVSVNKVNLYAVHENAEGPTGLEDEYSTLGVQYNLGSRSRVWIEYAGQDLDSDPNADDYITIGMRHDF